MKYISILVSTFGSGGAEKQAALLAQSLSKEYGILFVALYGEGNVSSYISELERNGRISIFILSGKLTQKFFQYAKILKNNDVCASFNYLTKPNFYGSIIERICGVTYVYNGIRTSNLEFHKSVLEWISHTFFASKTIFNCYSGEIAFHKKGFRASKCVTIPNAFPDISNPIRHLGNDIIRIITVGRFHHLKDYKTAIETISLIRDKGFRVIFMICGYGEQENLIKSWVQQYDIQELVEFHINPTNIPALLQQADIYLSTSVIEGTSNSIMEAMNWSLPIVATNVGDNSRMVIDGYNGYLAEPKDSESLSECIIKLIKDVDQRNRYGENGNRLLRDNYSLEIFEKRYLSLFEK